MQKTSSFAGQIADARKPASGKAKFMIAALVVLAAVVYLIVSSTRATAQYFLTVEELQARKSDLVGRSVRISGAVLGESIRYDSQDMLLRFTVVHIPGRQKEIDAQGGLAAVLHAAVGDAGLPRLSVVYRGVKPDLLKNEAQAIISGRLEEDGVFYADELLLKCPSRYEEALPEQPGG
ncbi:MAG: cytochrome c maturation protein CcmE [Anaerolineae bacterium]|nr:cytochrome c maturation protein CcmE [Anaerolineae bacterium]